MPNKTVIPLNQSQLYKLTSPRRLADVLGLAEAELRAMATGPDRYRQFEIEKKSGGKRPVEDPVAPLKRVQGRIAKMLARIEVLPQHAPCAGDRVLPKHHGMPRRRCRPSW